MPYMIGFVDGEDFCEYVPSNQMEQALQSLLEMPYTWFAVVDPYMDLGSDASVKISIKQQSSSLYPENQLLTFEFIDSLYGDKILSISGKMTDELEDFQSIVNVANASEYFKTFEIHTSPMFHHYITDCDALNLKNSLGRNFVSMSLDQDVEKVALNQDELYDAIVEADVRPNYLAMFFDGNTELFTTMLRVSEKLNIPLKVELNPTLTPSQMIEIASELGAYSHRVEIIACAVLARPNNSTSIYGKKLPRYALGTLMGYTLVRNAQTNAMGIPPLHRPVAGYDYPMRWSGMKMREDVKFNDDVRSDLAASGINIVMQERFDTGTRFVQTDCLTQYDSNNSVLNLSNSAEISMYIDNRLINICKRHLLKGKASFKTDALRECESFLEDCSNDLSGLLVDSAELGGKFVLDITTREDRPHDAVNLMAGYYPEGAVRAVYLNTGVYK